MIEFCVEPKYKLIILILCFEEKKSVFLPAPFSLSNNLFLKMELLEFYNVESLGRARLTGSQTPCLWLPFHSLSSIFGRWEVTPHPWKCEPVSSLHFQVTTVESMQISSVHMERTISGYHIRVTFNLFKEKTCFLYCIYSCITESFTYHFNGTFLKINYFSKLTIWW